MNRDTEQLLQRYLRAQTRELRAARRERERREWEQRLDDLLSRRGYARGIGKRR